MNISGSYSATSTTSPRPVRVRWNSAVVVPNAADRPAMESAKPNGGDVGGGSGQPLTNAGPPGRSATVPNPGRSRYGPVWPNPDTRVSTSPGFSAESTS